MMNLLESIGVSPFLTNIAWLPAYALFVPAMLMILHAMGYGIGSIARLVFRQHRRPIERHGSP
ncbi:MULTISPECIES: hypothetical protein [Methylobacterium]|uniref:hypothetical protein n=1 Tax=Methylobacterium TaxID=407 RepID=UPI0013EBFFC0|nr:hypothetical protein [Methylobacterium sp. DB0501]NGM35535.1 hypothetical protein [Methylobacterium sp. DB0501]